MSVAYVDSSVIVGIAFQDQGWAAIERRLAGFPDLRSSNLLEAEVRAAYDREGREFDSRVLSGIRWILPDRPLTIELRTAQEAGYLRGADLWHIATALYIAPSPGDISFVTLDDRQQTVAAALGFRTLRQMRTLPT